MISKLNDGVSYAFKLNNGDEPISIEECFHSFESFCEGILELITTDEKAILTVRDDKNHKHEINLLEDSSHIFLQLYPNFSKGFGQKYLDRYLRVTTEILSNVLIPLTLKIQIIDFENEYLSFPQVGFSEGLYGLTALESRLKTCKLILENSNDDVFDINSILNIYNLYIHNLKKTYINKGQFLQLSEVLKDMLINSKSTVEKKCILSSLIAHNTAFNLQSQRELLLQLDDYQEIFDTDTYDYLKLLICADPRGIVFSEFQTGRGKLSKKSTQNKEISTLIGFSIPFKCINTKSLTIRTKDNIEILFMPITEFWMDPIFRYAQDLTIGNISWSHYCDVERDGASNYTHLVISLPELYVPDVILEDNSSIPKDFSFEEAKMGKRYHPFKEKIVEIFFNLFDIISLHIQIEKKNININMFSNYLVSYLDKETNNIIHQKLFAITNPDSYSKTTTNYLERFNNVNLSDSLIAIKDLNKTIINSERSLNQFVYRALDIYVKHIIENHGGYQYLWKKDQEDNLISPLIETKIQPYIFGLLTNFFDFMGIKISREPKSGNGSIDFLVSFTTTDNKLIITCVELKLAHSSNIENGVLKQLPAYMKSQRSAFGIYLVLWFKSEIFDKPKKFESLDDLNMAMKELNIDPHIPILSIDCSKPIEPSKL